MKKKDLTCYFSFRSPYAWLAMKKLQDADLGIGSLLKYVPMFEPTAEIESLLAQMGGRSLYQPMSPEKHLYIMADVKRILAHHGIRSKWPVDGDADWSIPHLVFLACEDAKLQTSYVAHVMNERWLQGIDIWKWDYMFEVLASLTSVSEADRIISCAQSTELMTKAAEGLLSAYKKGIFGLPFMTIGRKKYWGNDRVQTFLDDLPPADDPSTKTSST